MSKVTLLVVTVVVLVASAAIVGWSFFGLGTTQAPSTTTSGNTTQAKKITPTQQAGCVPPVVDSSTLAFFNKNTNVYGLRGKLKEIREASKTIELITDIKGQNIPKFFVTPKTEIIFSDIFSGGKDLGKATMDDLKVNENVVLSIYCSARKTWGTGKVRIINAATPKVSPTP